MTTTLVLAQAERLRQWLQSGMSGALPAGLLDEQASFATLGSAVHGQANIEQALRSNNAAADYARLVWLAPEPLVDGKLRLQADPPRNHAVRGVVLTLTLKDGLLLSIEQQRRGVAPIAATPMVLPSALVVMINQALANGKPMLMAYVDAEEQPRLSFRGSTHVFSESQLAMWIRDAGSGFVASIAHAPRVSFMYRDNVTKATYQLQGRARVAHEESVRQRVYAAAPQVERDHDFAMLGVAVIVDLDLVEGYASLSSSGQVDRIRLQRGA